MRLFREAKSIAFRETRPLSLNLPLESLFSSCSSSDTEDSVYFGTRIELAVVFARFVYPVDRLASLRCWDVARFALIAIVEGRKERLATGVVGACGDIVGIESDILMLQWHNNDYHWFLRYRLFLRHSSERASPFAKTADLYRGKFSLAYLTKVASFRQPNNVRGLRISNVVRYNV